MSVFTLPAPTVLTGADLEKHSTVWANRERYAPDPTIAGVLRSLGIHPEVLGNLPVPLDQGAVIAAAWESTASDHADELTVDAYRAMSAQSDRMMRTVEDLGYSIEFTDEAEPYDTAAEQARHVRLDKRIRIASGLGGEHPVLTTEQYDRFRAVHDLFGHVGIGGGFDRHGEFQAWMVHVCMFRGLGAWAMSSEYRGVNSSLWAGSAAGTGKAALLPLRLLSVPV